MPSRLKRATGSWVVWAIAVLGTSNQTMAAASDVKAFVTSLAESVGAAVHSCPYAPGVNIERARNGFRSEGRIQGERPRSKSCLSFVTSLDADAFKSHFKTFVAECPSESGVKRVSRWHYDEFKQLTPEAAKQPGKGYARDEGTRFVRYRLTLTVGSTNTEVFVEYDGLVHIWYDDD